MGFYLQVKCNSCGYKTPGIDEEHTHISPLGLKELVPCVCNDCHELFQRESIYKENEEPKTINKCVFCGSENITVLEDGKVSKCPKCGSSDIELDCIGYYF